MPRSIGPKLRLARFVRRDICCAALVGCRDDESESWPGLVGIRLAVGIPEGFLDESAGSFGRCDEDDDEDDD